MIFPFLPSNIPPYLIYESRRGMANGFSVSLAFAQGDKESFCDSLVCAWDDKESFCVMLSVDEA